ncbi:MAG: AEC family transporter [Magnetococcales bacterium]|nr:AEC family transporter [Magnetococcales bacterium]
MENFLLIILALALGMGLHHLRLLPPESALVLNQFVIYVSLPALVLLRVPHITLSQELLAPVLTPWILLFLSALVVLVMARVMTWSRPVTGALMLVIPLGNTSFLGVPMVQAFFGQSGVAIALLYDQVGTFTALATYGSIVVATYSDGQQPTPGTVLKKILTFPPFIAMLMALSLRQVTLPPPLIHVLESLAATLIPVVMVAVGFQFRILLPRSLLFPLLFALGFKLVASPLATALLCHLAGWSGLPASVTVFESGMPAMITAGALATAAGLAPDLAAAVVGFGILLSFLTLPLLAAWLA